jgi:hypothetical protein
MSFKHIPTRLSSSQLQVFDEVGKRTLHLAETLSFGIFEISLNHKSGHIAVMMRLHRQDYQQIATIKRYTKALANIYP